MTTKVISELALVIVLPCWFVVVSIHCAAFAYGDDSPAATGGTSHGITSAEPRPVAATPAPAEGSGPAGTRVTPESSTPAEATTSPSTPPAHPQWPWLEDDPGHDKCKRQMPWPMPLWCFGLDSWPVMRAHAPNATVKGIQHRPAFHPVSPGQSLHRGSPAQEGNQHGARR